MNVAKTILLAIALLVLGGYAFLDQTGTLKKWFDTPVTELLRPNLDQLTGFTITNPNGAVRVTREGDDWRLVEPFEDKADFEWAVNTMNTLGQMAVAKVMDPSANQAGLGFDPNQSTTLAVQYGEAAGPRYVIGGNGPTKETTYVKSAEGLFLVVGEFDEVRTITAETLIDPVLTRFDPSSILSVDLKLGDQPSIELARKSAIQAWHVKKPYTHSAADDLVNQWLARWSTIDVLGIVPRAKADTVMPESGPEVHSIKLWEDDPKKVLTIQLHANGEDKSKTYVRVSNRPLVYETSSAILETCPDDPETLRETRLLRVMAADVEGLAIAMPGRDPVRLQQTGTTWSFATTDNSIGELVDPEQPDRLFKLLSDTQVTDYFTENIDDLSRFGLTEPYMTLQLEGFDLGPAEAKRLVMNVGYPVVAGETPPPLAFVMFDGLPFVAGIDRSFLTSLSQMTSPLKWKQRGVLNIAYDTFREISITPKDGQILSVSLDLLNQDPDKRIQAFQGEKEVTTELDMGSTSVLISLLGGLSAERWLEPRSEVTTALSEPTVEINVSTSQKDGTADEAATQRWTIRLAPTVRDMKEPSFYYGSLEGNPTPFLLKAEVVDILSGKHLLMKAP